MAIRLNETAVRKAQCPPDKKDVLIFDDALPGYALRVCANGNRIFLFQYSLKGRKRRAVLGKWGVELTEAAARKKAEVMRGKYRDGKDPVGESLLVKDALLKIEAADKAAAAASLYTVDHLITDWRNKRLSKRSAKYRKNAPILLRRALADSLRTPAATYSDTAAENALEAEETRTSVAGANRLHKYAGSCWQWAVDHKKLKINPWASTPKPGEDEERQRALTLDELVAVYNAAGVLNEPKATLVRLLILLGQRRLEVGGMRWGELDLKEGMWLIPAKRMKMKQPHTVALTPEVVAMIRTIPRRDGSNLVFENERGTVFSSFAAMKAELDKSVVDAGFELEHWIFHDLRRSMVTQMQKIGIRQEVSEAVLSHVTKAEKGVSGIYHCHKWDAEKVIAMRAWNTRLLRAVSGLPWDKKLVRLGNAA